jgi:hypothetical protein
MAVTSYRLVRERPNSADPRMCYYRIERKTWFGWQYVAEECFLLESPHSGTGDERAQQWFKERLEYIERNTAPQYPQTIATKDVTS